MFGSNGYTSLAYTCEILNVSYDSATRGKRHWLNDNQALEIKEVQVVKIKNRGRK